jgi:hypothetical protein
VRNVGYRFVPLKVSEEGRRGHARDTGPAAGAPVGEPGGTGGAGRADDATGNHETGQNHETGRNRGAGRNQVTGDGPGKGRDAGQRRVPAAPRGG